MTSQQDFTGFLAFKCATEILIVDSLNLNKNEYFSYVLNMDKFM